MIVKFLSFFIPFSLMCAANTYAQWLPVLEWSRIFSGPLPYNATDAARYVNTDNAGNIYVSGYSNGDASLNDVLTVKYNAAGDTLWTRRFNGSGNSDDVPVSQIVDAQNNVYIAVSAFSVTSSKYYILKYSAAGSLLWAAPADNMWDCSNTVVTKCMDIDATGNVFVTAGTFQANKNYCTIKFNPAGDTVWKKTLNGSGNASDNPTALKTDAGGNVIVTGSSWNGSSYDYLTVKYSPGGTLLWQSVYNGLGNGTDYPYAVDADSSGNVYITGEVKMTGPASNTDFATIKYNAAGIQKWVALYNYPDSLSDKAQAVMAATYNQIYVAGTSYGSSPNDGGTGNDFCLIKYDSSGNEQWVRRYNGSGNDEDIMHAMNADEEGNIYMTGESYDDHLWKDMALISYDNSGNLRWTTRYDTDTTQDVAYGIASNLSGNVYICGISDYNYCTLKYGQVLNVETRSKNDIFMVYPVPARDCIKLCILKDGITEATAIISDITGKILFSEPFECYATQNNTISLNIGQLKAGFYVISIYGRGFSASEKFMVY